MILRMIDGYLYLAQLYPDRAPYLFKIGFSTNPGNRALDHKCLAPKLRLLKTWKANPSHEQKALEAVADAGLLYGGEVVCCDQVEDLIQIVEKSLNN